jgi:hypothetical protein
MADKRPQPQEAARPQDPPPLSTRDVAKPAAVVDGSAIVAPDAAPQEPGWSNSPEDHGIGAREAAAQAATPAGGIDMSQPGWSNNGPPATGATAGTPGVWTPPNADTPNSFTKMDTITAAPATAWTAGQYVVLGDGSEAHWGGAAWTSGRA